MVGAVSHPEPNPVRVLLVDDHAVLLDGLSILISAEGDMEVVGLATTRSDAVREAERCRPDVAVVDLLIPGGGLGAISDLREVSPSTQVLVLTILDDTDHLQAVVDRGGRGYVVKRSAARELLTAIRTVAAGATHFEPASRLLAQPLGERAFATDVSLSSRETQVLRLLALGLTHKEIAARLDVSKKSVDTYRLRLQRKLNLAGRADLVRYAIATGQFGDPSDK